MNFNKLTISDLVDQQLPEFVVNEFPTFVKFFEEYYKSLELSGGLLDITNNFLDYKNIDNLRKYNLVTTYKLQQAISTTDDTIVLDSLDGLPSENGLISIGNEIILYETVNLSSRTLLNCKRGYTATTKFDGTATTVESTVAASHRPDDTVTNLSNLVLFLILRNYEHQYLAGFPFENISSSIDKDTLITNIKDFYNYKGTDISIEFLFRALFDEEITVKYPKDYVIKASYSDFTVDDIIKVEAIEGDPYSLIGNQLNQSDASGVLTSSAVIDEILINNISNYASANKTVYECRLNVLNQQFFQIPRETILRGVSSSTDSVITVDSTIGFPQLNGIIQIDDEVITYRYKTFNQFIDCGRGVFNTVAVNHADLSDVRTTEFLFGYSDGIELESNKVSMRLLGVSSSVTVDDGGAYFEESEKVELSPDGDIDSRQQFTTWIKNETGTLSSSSDVQINNNVSTITTEISNIYKDDNYVYLVSSGLPVHPIGSFIGTGFRVNNQNLLKAIPLSTEKNTQVQFTGNKAVGLFINGVEAFSSQDYEDISFGNIESVEIIQKGFGFETDIQPVFRVANASGAGATFNANIIDGKVFSVSVVNGGNGYTQNQSLEVTYGFNGTATIANDADIINGSIKTITVTNPGQDYVATPNVEIIDSTGKGTGAFAIAEITNNQLTGIIVLNGGVDYSDKNTITVRIVSKGTGVVANAVVKKWSFDRVFKTKNSIDINGNWALAQTIKSDTGNGYLYPSRNIAYNLQYAYPSNPKILRHSLSDNVQGVNANYDEKTSGFVHSPILGWAYDGNPIYGPYGYLSPTIPANGISRQTSSYALKTAAEATRPSVVKYPLGSFINDYEFIQGSGSLDINNGRFCITPEYPEGRYCYFITVDTFGGGVYPYIIGKTYYSVPSENNFNIEFNQQNEDNLPKEVRRIRSSSTPSKGFDAILSVSNVERGTIDDFVVNESESVFKVLDSLYIDNNDTEGSRAFGRVGSVKGENVTTLSYQVASGSTIPSTNGIPDAPWPSEISAPQYTDTKYDVTVETSTPHLLSDHDIVTLALDRQAVSLTKTFKVRVSNYQTVNYTAPVVESFLVVDVAFNQTTINVDNSDDYRENDYLKLNDEILKIVSIDYNSDQITVERTQFGSPLRLHAATNKVELYIPDDQPDYRITVGSAITSSGVSGTIYSIDKENSVIEIRVGSGTLTNSSVLTDTSSPTGRTINVSSVGSTQIYWEFDPTGTGNYYVRDLSFRLIRGTQYIFDTSDGSIFGYSLIFSEDSANINTVTGVTSVGTPGTSGSSVTITKDALLNVDVSRVYYYEQNGQILNNKTFFSVLTFPDGIKTIKVVNDNSFKFTISKQPEETTYTNLVSYSTTSQTSIGAINTVTVVDGGEGYKKLPKISGIIHTELDAANLTYSITGGSFDDTFSVLNPGNRYSSNTEIIVNTLTGSGAVLTPTIVGGKIISVKVTVAGNGYDENDTISIIDTGAKIFPISDSIGRIKTIRFNNSGSQFNPDRTFSKSLVFKQKVIITGIAGGVYKLSENITSSGGLSAKIEKIREIGVDIYLLDLKINSGAPKVGDTLTGSVLQVTSTIYSVTNPDVIGNIAGFISKVGFFDSDLGKISASSQKITDSYYYQDFSYVIRSTKSLSDYKKYVDETTHPLGFKLFGEVSVENDVDFADTVTGNAFSIGLADDHSANEVIITLPNVNVESDIVFKKYEISTLKTANLKAYRGIGAARLNFLDNQIEAVQMADLSADLDASTQTYTLTTQDGNFPLDTFNTSILLSLNDVFQEPFQTSTVSGISYSGGIATITTAADHNLATTSAGQTYPNQKYIHISDVTNTGNLNFNDQFEVYDVPSTTSIRVLFNNPNGFLTNNNPAVCADVQSTIDNLVSILTYYLNNPSVALPTNNTGVWLDEASSTVVSANRHRDGANLIDLNRFEIIDRANAEISLQYPDFYYPNDTQTNGYSRQKDAYRLIQQNRKELIDRGAAEIAVQYPDFVYPLDPATASDYRFKDAYRLIQQNRKEVVDRAAAQIGVSFPDYVYPLDPATASDYRFKDAYRLIQQNRTEIINNAWTTMQGGSNPADAAVETKCKRDIGLFIDYTSLDLVNGGNEYARKFALQYFDGAGNPLTNGLLGEELASVDGFTAAKDNMILAFTNQLTITDTTITADPAGAPLCANVTSAITVLAGIVNDAITAGSTTGLPVETIGSDTTGEGKCKRDLGLFIDYSSIDLVNGGNEYIRKFVLQYFDGAGSPITNGLLGEEAASVVAFNFARDQMIKAFTNELLIKDLTITADPAGAPLCANVTSAITVLSGIATSAITAGSIAGLPAETIGADTTGEAKCKRDLGLFIDAVSLDVHTGGNVYAVKFLKKYFNAQGTSFISNGLSGEILESNTAFNKVRDLMKQAIVNQLLVKDLTITSANANYWGTAVGTPTDVTYDAVTGFAQVTIANHGLNNGDDVVIKTNGLTFSCGMDGNVAEKSYPRLADGNHEQSLAVSNVTNDTFDITVGASPEKTFTISDANYDPASGDVELTIGNHSLRAGTSVKIEPESITFTCDFDNNQTQHSYPKSAILSETVTDASYDPILGVLTVTVKNHGWENGDLIKFDDDSLVFTCGMDGNATNHPYPRSTDPFSGKWIPIYAVTGNTFRVAIGVSSNTSTHTFVSAVDDGLKKKKDKTFDTAVSIVTKTATTITINVGSSTDTSVHTYVPRLYTVTDATYDPVSGILGITSNNHGFTAGDNILLGDGSLTFSCTCDGNVSEISYPRSTDPASQKRLNVISATNNQLTVNIGSSPIVNYTPTNATYDGSTGLMEVTIGTHGINANTTVKMLDNGITFTCGAATGTHTFVSGVTNAITPNSGPAYTAAAGTTYNPTTGDMVLEIGSHSLTTSNTVQIANGAVTFTCDADNNGSNHAYPRATDPVSGQDIAITAVGATTITVNVGVAAPPGDTHSYPRTLIDSFTVTGTTYTASTGAMTVTVNDHGMVNGDWIKFEDDSLTFTCDQDSHGSNHTYPRSTDPVSGKFIQISNVTQDTFDVNVGESPAGQQYAHLFVSAVADGLKHKRDRSYNQPIPVVSVTDTTITLQVGTTSIVSAHTFASALTDAIISGGNYTHTFVSATSSALNQAVIISGSEYSHTFIKAVTDAIVRPVVNSPVSNNSDDACADIKSNIDTLVEIVTIYLTQGSLTFPSALPIQSVRVPSAGEAKCKRDLSLIVDSVISDMRTGGNSNIRSSTKKYLDGAALLSNGLAGEIDESITAFNKARDLMKLAIANQLYIQDLTILPDFLTTSGTIEASSLTNSIFTEGQFEYSNAVLKLYEAVAEGTVFHSTFFKFVSAGDDNRYSYKLKNILFDGVSKDYPLYKINGTNVTTEADENLLVFIDGVLQLHGESYTIDRSVNPNVIKFTDVIEKDRHFFSYTFSKYKVLNNFADKFNSSAKSFEFAFGEDNILPPDDHQMLVMLDGIPQVEGSAYTIVDNVITFTEAPTAEKECYVLYFYGKVFDKTISIWNGEVFENLEYIGDNSPEGCQYLNKVANTGDIIKSGDKIRIDGESVKEIIRVEERALKNTDNLVYTALVYTDNSYIRGKNAVANAVIDPSSTMVSGGNPVGIDGTVGVEFGMGIPTVFAPGPITSINITNPGLEYDVAPIILFKTECDNPGTGAEAIAQITNGKVTNVIITNGGSGYTAAPELIFAKKYEIIRPHTPLFMRNNTIIDVSLANALLPGFNVVNESELEDIIPLVSTQLTTSRTNVLEIERKTNRDTSRPGLSYVLETFDNNKFSYEPQELNDPLASYLGTGVTIEMINRYAPALTISDFTTHRGATQGATEPNIINIGPEAYVAYGLTLNGNINDTVTTITVTGNVSNFPPSGYLEFGDEIVQYTSISGQDFTVVRGVKGTTATSHTDTDYLRLAWRG